MSRDYVVPKMSNVFVIFPCFFEGLFWGENTHSGNNDSFFYQKYRANYHDAHRKYIYPKFE